LWDEASVYLLLTSSIAQRSRLFAGLNCAETRCDLTHDIEEAPSVLQHSGPYDAAILELAAPGELEALRSALRVIRARGLSLPVVVVCDPPGAAEEVSLLTVGADDVLCRPVLAADLRHRMRALLRRSLGHSSAELRCGNAVLDQGRQSVEVDGRPVRLSPREFEVLEMLMLRPGVPISKDRFMATLYGSEEGPSERILDVFVCKLRRKLAAASAGATIRTVWGCGYRIEEPAVALAAGEASGAASLVAPGIL
jgi:two-component system, cell cycle response regulator CtrA